MGFVRSLTPCTDVHALGCTLTCASVSHNVQRFSCRVWQAVVGLGLLGPFCEEPEPPGTWQGLWDSVWICSAESSRAPAPREHLCAHTGPEPSHWPSQCAGVWCWLYSHFPNGDTDAQQDQVPEDAGLLCLWQP